MFCFLQVFLTLLSSALLALAIPNELFSYGSPLLGLFSLVPFYIVVSRSRNYRMTFALACLHGGTVHLLSSFWLKNFQGMAAFTLGGSLLGTALIEGVMSFLMYYPFSKRTQISDSSRISFYEVPLKVIWFAAVYVMYEWGKSTGFLGYPWGVISMTAYRWHIFTQIADITGRWGITFLFVLFSALTGQGLLMLGEQKNTHSFTKKLQGYNAVARCTIALFILSFAYGTYQYAKPRTVVKKVDTVMVQQNMHTYRANEEEAILHSQIMTDKGMAELLNSGSKADLVVWSEGVLNKYFPNSQSYYEVFPDIDPLMKFLRNKKTPFIIGGSYAINTERHKFGNAALFFDKKGQLQGRYIKLHLVPFAEIIPFVDYEPVRKFIKKIAGFSYGWTPGDKYVLFEIPVKKENCIDTNPVQIVSAEGKKQTAAPSVLVSTPICFDDAFTHVCRGLFLSGTELFMNITNDSWSQTNSSEIQHFVIASYRAIEYRTTFARCTNAGVTAVIDPAGRTISSLPLFVEDYMAYSIPVYERKMTVYARFGDWVPVVTLSYIIFIMILLEHMVRSRTNPDDISTELVRRRKTTTKDK